MNLEKFEKQMKESLEKNSQKLYDDFLNNKEFIKLIDKKLMKNWWLIVHIEYDMLSFLSLIEKIKENPKLKNKLSKDIDDVDAFYKSMLKCETCIYAIFQEIHELKLRK